MISFENVTSSFISSSTTEVTWAKELVANTTRQRKVEEMIEGR